MRHNNICIYGINKATEESPMLAFADNFLNRNADLQIQQACLKIRSG